MASSSLVTSKIPLSLFHLEWSGRSFLEVIERPKPKETTRENSIFQLFAKSLEIFLKSAGILVSHPKFDMSGNSPLPNSKPLSRFGLDRRYSILYVVIYKPLHIGLMTNYCESMSMDGTLSSMGYKPE
jgi:hypothetical protein